MTASRSTDAEDRATPLVSNAAAIRAVAAAVEGTLGPKGLNCMLVDRFGEVIITNDGNTILEKLDATHPAAQLLVNVARAQAAQVGDGTTTATVLASALISEGVTQIGRGVPVTRVLEGLRVGIAAAIDGVSRRAIPIREIGDPLLRQAVLVAGRQEADIAALCLEAAACIGGERLTDPAFRLADWIVAREGADSAVVQGVILDKEPVNRQMPCMVRDASVLCLDDALEPDDVDSQALGTEAGFAAFTRYQQEFRAALQRLTTQGVRVLFVTKAVHAIAEDVLTEAGMLIIRRLTSRDLQRVARHTGARPVKRSMLKRSPEEFTAVLGHAVEIVCDERLGHTRITGGAGEAMATILLGAATAEVRAERARVAEDAACALQAALRGGVVPGGGAILLAVLCDVAATRALAGPMAAYGVDSVTTALREPLARIVANAGFNPLEKVEEVLAAMEHTGADTLAIDCDTGAVADMLQLGVVDPAPVTTYALRAAGEVAEAILRINTVIRKREEPSGVAGGSAGA